MTVVFKKICDISLFIGENEDFIRLVSRRFDVSADHRDELLQIGRIAMVKAYLNFQCERGVPFRGYAWKCVLNEMSSAMRKFRCYYKWQVTGKDTYPCTYAIQESNAEEDHDRLCYCLNLLANDERDLIRRRFGIGGQPRITLHTLAKEKGVSHETIRRLEKKVLARLQALFANEVC